MTHIHQRQGVRLIKNNVHTKSPRTIRGLFFFSSHTAMR